MKTLLKRALIRAYGVGLVSQRNTQRIYDFFRLSRY